MPNIGPRNPIGPAPLRRLNSIRRTSTIDVGWPGGQGGDMLMVGRARDIFTPADGGAPIVLAEDSYRLRANVAREIQEISTVPDLPQLQKLVGARGGGHMRGLIGELIPQEKAAARPLYLILDDYSGMSLVANWIWTVWKKDWTPEKEKEWAGLMEERRAFVLNVCTGFAEGSSALEIDYAGDSERDQGYVVSLRNPEDPDGWHAFYEHGGVAARRARRIDLWREGDMIALDVGFQDSGNAPEGRRAAVHEYQVQAKVRADDFTLVSLDVDPRILPFQECPGAIVNAKKMIGKPISGFRMAVLETLPRQLGCTHLNDVLRSLEDVPVLTKRLQAS